MAPHSSFLVWRIPRDRGAYWATVHEVAKSRTRLSDYVLRACWTSLQGWAHPAWTPLGPPPQASAHWGPSSPPLAPILQSA